MDQLGKLSLSLCQIVLSSDSESQCELFVNKPVCLIEKFQDSVIQLWSILRGDDPAEQCEPQLAAQTSLKGDVAAMEVSIPAFIIKTFLIFQLIKTNFMSLQYTYIVVNSTFKSLLK